MKPFKRPIIVCSLGLTGALLSSCDAANPYIKTEPLRVPRISVLTPATDNTPADSSVDIQITFERVLVNDTWNLYYVSDATPSVGKAIGIGLPVTSRAIQWDTSAEPAGRYFIYAELNSLDAVVTASAPGSVLLSHAVEEGNRAPQVSLSAPNGGESLVAGESTTIRFQGNDADGDAVTYKIEYTADDGLTWTTLVDGLTETTYTWDLPASMPASFLYRLRVIATDTKTATAADISDRNFSIR